MLTVKEYNKKYSALHYTMNQYEVLVNKIGLDENGNVIKNNIGVLNPFLSKETCKGLDKLNAEQLGEFSASLIKDLLTSLKMIDNFRDYQLPKMEGDFLKTKRIVRDWLNKLDNTAENQIKVLTMLNL